MITTQTIQATLRKANVPVGSNREYHPANCATVSKYNDGVIQVEWNMNYGGRSATLEGVNYQDAREVLVVLRKKLMDAGYDVRLEKTSYGWVQMFVVDEDARFYPGSNLTDGQVKTMVQERVRESLLAEKQALEKKIEETVKPLQQKLSEVNQKLNELANS